MKEQEKHAGNNGSRKKSRKREMGEMRENCGREVKKEEEELGGRFLINFHGPVLTGGGRRPGLATPVMCLIKNNQINDYYSTATLDCLIDEHLIKSGELSFLASPYLRKRNEVGNPSFRLSSE